jgi:ferredoxin-NADP reductase
LPSGYTSGRIDVKKVLATTKPNPNSFYFICGRQDFVGDIWRALTTAGIDQGQIATETFF